MKAEIPDTYNSTIQSQQSTFASRLVALECQKCGT
jgi:hypothetical protein